MTTEEESNQMGTICSIMTMFFLYKTPPQRVPNSHQDPSWISWGTFILDQIQKGVIIKLDFMDIPMQQSSTEAENSFQQ
jgi:hypothetical protein